MSLKIPFFNKKTPLKKVVDENADMEFVVYVDKIPAPEPKGLGVRIDDIKDMKLYWI